MKLCFASDELRQRFFEHVSIYEARLLVTTLKAQHIARVGTYITQFPKIGVSLRGSCVKVDLHLSENDAPEIRDVVVLHRGGLRGFIWSIRGRVEQFFEWFNNR